MTTCINVNAQDVNSYTHIRKKRKQGKNIHVQEIIPMKNKPHAHDTHTRVHAHERTHTAHTLDTHILYTLTHTHTTTTTTTTAPYHTPHTYTHTH